MKPFFCTAIAALSLGLAVVPCATIWQSGSALAAGAKGHDGPRVHRFGAVSRSGIGTVRVIRVSTGRLSVGRTVKPFPKVKVIRFGGSRTTRSGIRSNAREVPFTRFAAFALPDQTLFPPYYRADRAYVQRPDIASRLEGGLTVRQGSPLRSQIKAARTVKEGARRRSTIRGGRTVEQGSRYRSRITAGRTVEKGSRWASTIGNWRFSGYAAPVRPKGIPYYRPRW